MLCIKNSIYPSPVLPIKWTFLSRNYQCKSRWFLKPSWTLNFSRRRSKWRTSLSKPCWPLLPSRPKNLPHYLVTFGRSASDGPASDATALSRSVFVVFNYVLNRDYHFILCLIWVVSIVKCFGIITRQLKTIKFRDKELFVLIVFFLFFYCGTQYMKPLLPPPPHPLKISNWNFFFFLLNNSKSLS